MDYLYPSLPSSLRLGRAVLPAAALLLAACGGGGGDSGPSSVTISGIVEYEFVPPNPNCQGLDFASTVVRPIRGATLQLVDSSNAYPAKMAATRFLVSIRTGTCASGFAPS
jgi:hypothetical protein